MESGQCWRSPEGQVYQILEIQDDRVRTDIHDEEGGLTPNTWTFSKQQFERMVNTMPLTQVSPESRGQTKVKPTEPTKPLKPIKKTEPQKKIEPTKKTEPTKPSKPKTATTAKREIIVTLLNARRPDLANAVAKTKLP